ncbi:hypothetical protein [Kiloniella sp.]|uniref:hypothetical protein n=1 Tax=Kiloniella sp. TaxID=1938587 RepID=UPI003B0124F9
MSILSNVPLYETWQMAKGATWEASYNTINRKTREPLDLSDASGTVKIKNGSTVLYEQSITITATTVEVVIADTVTTNLNGSNATFEIEILRQSKVHKVARGKVEFYEEL